ncbi:MAG: hypothetical protein M1833_000947 [Piccolia ochrophora]|nr:MAG: hypothetical protein M1833_000947 [Piccolia ochrophora]
MFSRSPLKARGDELCAIYIHAGAGYHSKENEHAHLKACRDAADAAMKLLREGATAVSAVEMAIKVLENREITNAGYGSNLAIDGTVECDATVVDHYGRSGAVGAVAQIRHPISLARLVLTKSLEPLTLRRVPPNLLVGEGATKFASDNGVPILPHDALVSEKARERYVQWCDDLRKAQPSEDTDIDEAATDPDAEMGLEYEEQARRRIRAEHTKNMQGQAPTHRQSPSVRSFRTRDGRSPVPSLAMSDADSPRTPGTPFETSESTREPLSRIEEGRVSPRESLLESMHSPYHASTSGRQDDATVSALNESDNDLDQPMGDVGVERPESGHRRGVGRHDGSTDSEQDPSSEDTLRLSSARPCAPHAAALLSVVSPLPPMETTTCSSDATFSRPQLNQIDSSQNGIPSMKSVPNKQMRVDDDLIDDTVGAIAVDHLGHIAAGSSSGGIGMKHRGRVGPAALVGVGSAVIPSDPTESTHMTVACVTSGTGEHMATTMAAAKCAERLYQHVVVNEVGLLEDAQDDEVIMQSVIQKDFMDHPGVKKSVCAGAIGILAVKKSKTGIYVYFAHNTDSFAVASMHSNDRVPQCTMSRIHGDSGVAQGGRGLRYKRR